MKIRFVEFLIYMLSALAIVSCSSRHVAEKPDTTRPSIISISPASDATAVAVDATITIVFSEGMNVSTINNTSISLASTTTTTVAGTVTYDTSSYVATFTTNSPLEHNTNYIATITTDATDVAGNTISAPFAWSFTTIPAPGALDLTFGTGGKVKTAFGNSNNTAFAAAIQQDGNIVTADSILATLSTSTTTSTTITVNSFTDHYFAISRFQPNGTLDATFGFTQNGWSDDIVGTARTVELQPDGKIVAAGDTGARDTITSVTSGITVTTTSTLSKSDFLIARYNANGTLDTTFGSQSNGTTTTNVGFDNAIINSLAIQTDDGSIVVAGDGRDSGSSRYASILARFKSDGNLDTSFASGVGWRKDTIGVTSSRARIVKIQPDGKIVTGGDYLDGSGLASCYLARYESNGVPDTSFSSGMVTISTGTNSALADFKILADGKILVAGTTANITNGTADIFLMRYKANGTLDSTFGSDGIVITDDIIHGSETAAALAVQADDKIVVVASFHAAVGAILTNDFALLRYDAGGVLDTTFGNGFGMITTDLGSNNDDYAYDVQIQQDGKITVVGTTSNGSTYDLGLVRYWP